MEPALRPRFKVCCIASAAEARLAIDAGASALGLVSSMPSGPGVIAEELIAEIASSAPPGVDTFLLTSLQDPEAIIEQHRAARTSTLQLVDELSPAAHARLREALPGVRLVQVIHVTGPISVEQAERAARHVHAVLLDSGNPDLEVKELGGTGRRHDWSVSAVIREQLDIPVFLAGGLTPDNAADALRAVGPWALDICSGLRDADFCLDPSKLTHLAAVVDDAALHKP